MFVIVTEQTYILIGQNASVSDSINCIARTDFCCDWSLQIPVVNNHMTLTEQQSDWNAQIPFPGPRILGLCPCTPDPFSLTEGGVWG